MNGYVTVTWNSPWEKPTATDENGNEVSLPAWVEHQWASGHEMTFGQWGVPEVRCAECDWPTPPPPPLPTCPTCHGLGWVQS